MTILKWMTSVTLLDETPYLTKLNRVRPRRLSANEIINKEVYRYFLVNTMLTLKVACNVTKAGPDGHVTTDVSEELPPVSVTTV